jgi:hypothetical protein
MTFTTHDQTLTAAFPVMTAHCDCHWQGLSGMAFQITIKAADGSVMSTLDVRAVDNVAALQRRLGLEPTDYLHFKGKRLDATHTLGDYGIRGKSTLTVSDSELRPGGAASASASGSGGAGAATGSATGTGGAGAGAASGPGTTATGMVRGRGGMVPIVFSDVERHILQRKEFSDSAPDWRTVVPGLNLEGTCSNRRCEAHLSRVILMVRPSSFCRGISSCCWPR